MPIIAIIIVFSVSLSLVLFCLPFLKGTTIRRITAVASLLALAGTAYGLHGQAEFWQLLFLPQYPALLHRLSYFLVFSTEGISGPMLLMFAVMVGILALHLLATNTDTLRENRFFAWFWLSVGLGFAIFAAAHFYLLVFLWGVSVIPLFMLTSGFEDERAALAKKTLILFGGAHVLMVTGAVMAVSLSGSADITSMQTATTTATEKASFLLLLSGGLVATGIFPFQSWIIPYAKIASIRSFALMALVFQRLAGAYLLIRLCHDIFIMGETLRVVLFSLGFISAIIPLAMALAEPEPISRLAKLHLALGGMILTGIATGTRAGIVAALILATVGGAIMMPFLFAISHKKSLAVSSDPAFYGLAGIRLMAAFLKWQPVKGKRLFNAFNRMEKSAYTDIYQLGSKVVFTIYRPLTRLHDGVLQTYLVWVVVALIVLFLLK